jgi:erythromycin 3''-O-methyltransferase
MCNFYYNHILNTYFIKDNHIAYSCYLKIIQLVSEKNYYINYGLWDKKNNTLIKANKHLACFVFKKAVKERKSNQVYTILDVGCGYGTQDFLWNKKLNSLQHPFHITAIDISEKQITYANNKKKRLNIKNKSLTFELCDAMKIVKKYKEKSFDSVISLESAFHYSNRPYFFNQVHHVLNEGGTFVIADIMLSDDYKSSVVFEWFLKIASDFFQIPKKNLITSEEWKNSLISSGFQIESCENITTKTFSPYYKHFFQNYSKKKGFPDFIGNALNSMFQSIQPFCYNVAVCKK